MILFTPPATVHPVATQPAPAAIVASAKARPGVGDLRQGQTYLPQIGWTPPSTRRQGPIVAVLDTGVDASHPNLKDAVIPGGRTFVSGGGNPNSDSASHGTQVAGIIAARLVNGNGVAGISRARILPIKIADENGRTGTPALIRGINYAVARRARIINISFDGGRRSPVEQNAINNAVRRGLIVVVASGNTGRRQIAYPGAYRQVVSVGAVDEAGQRLDVSTMGPQITLAAPGGNILSTVPGGNYEAHSGTSYAAAVVTGAAARVWTERPKLTASQVVEILERTTNARPRNGRNEQVGVGVVNLAAALRARPARSDSPEPNDEPREAARTAAALPGARQQAVVDGRVSAWRDPRDGYRVVLRTGDTLTATLSGPPGVDMDLRLWRPNTPTVRRARAFTRTWLAAASFRPTSQESFTFSATTPGVYTVEVDGNGATGNYRLTLQRRRG